MHLSHPYSTFCQVPNNQMAEPMFFGQNVNVARYDQQKHPVFEKLIEKQLSFFWRPEEVDVSRDRADYQALPEHEKHIFISNLNKLDFFVHVVCLNRLDVIPCIFFRKHKLSLFVFLGSAVDEYENLGVEFTSYRLSFNYLKALTIS